MDFKEMEKRIKNDGWFYVYTRGPHYYYEHPVKSGKIPIPFHSGDIKKGTLNSILKPAGLK